ncbi:hypothetical protein [Capnocytophaga felis]|uniref:Uncharacterized protein n=1 Tax=Capnocytophaga felis TaxID=2267611 RepID=A0A5M4B760_9FLAO|nr:hypothetical protein [Capnocytophaga felis]GET45441.1 hypothetical protein RCZ01_07430 [Capnocytophaga felis]GET47396.1 hypothetical protein RCZ02_02270 [Capnocytophaga felis]
MRGALPYQLQYVIHDENVEFIIFANRVASWKTVLGNFVMGLIFSGVGVFVLDMETNSFAFSHYFENGKKANFWELISSYNLGLLAFGILFSLVGVLFFVSVIHLTFSEGGYFVGTPTRLIHYKKGDVKIYMWELFTDEIKVDIDKKYIRLILKIGKYERKDKTEVFVPDKIEIISAENVSKIEKVARERIYSLSHLTK